MERLRRPGRIGPRRPLRPEPHAVLRRIALRPLSSIVVALAATAALCAHARADAPSITVVPTGAAARSPLVGRMLIFIAPAKGGSPPQALDPGFVADGFALVGFDVRRPAGGTIAVPPGAQSFPRSLAALAPGTYDLQALLDTRRMYTYDGIGAGDLTGPVIRARIAPGAKIALSLATVVAESPGAPTAAVRFFSVRSATLSTWYHAPVDLRASVVLPERYDPAKRYPVVYRMNGFGGTWRSGFGIARERAMMAADGMEAIVVVPDSSGPTGITQFADSPTNGPWGTAFVRDFVPAIERAFPIEGTAKHRFLWGHSSGGWASLWLQVTYPSLFGGAWSSSPDPVDFHDFTGPDLLALPAENAYLDPYGRPWQLVRDGGRDLMTLRDFVRSSDVMGYRESQFGSFDAVFSPPGPDGRPRPLFDHRSGRIDPSVAAYWEAHYDIAATIEREWPRYGAELTRKIHIAVGTLDTFHLERGVLRLDARMRRLGATPDITYFPDASHFSPFSPSTGFEGYHWAFRGIAAASR